MWRILTNDEGQMSVELAVVIPVVLAVMLIVVDGLAYVGECARFEQVAPQTVLACAVTAGGDDSDVAARTAVIAAALAEEFDARGQEVEVSAASSWGVTTYSCTLKMAPWPLGSGGVSFFGVHLPTTLSHCCAFAVDPYVTGALI